MTESMERELRNVDHWLSINKMTINTKKLRLFSLEIRHISSRNLTTKRSGIWILHSKEKIKSNILEYFLMIKCNGSTKSETSPKRLI